MNSKKNMQQLFDTKTNNNGNGKLFKKFVNKKKLDEAEKLNIDQENWIDLILPYSDLVTILLVFFIFFYIFNIFSDEIPESAASQFAKHSSPAESSKEIEENMERVDSTQTIIEKERLENLTKAERDTIGGLKQYLFTISGEILFESGKSKIKRMAESTLRLIAMQLKQKIGNDPNWQIRIEGHTDNIPINTARFQSNWELSTARAVSVVQFFLENYYFKPDQLQAMGYGEYNPIASNLTAQGRKINRRVEIKLIYSKQ